ncbi:MFS transporter [Streptomyces sp. NPDC047917]|uniref:MFS transporter n=1 Tax=Streptomyces sp. NPDC047917 TaxID=3365491 RepID=UPI0037177D7C
MSMLQFFIAVDVTVVNIALPSIGADFGVDGHALTWVVVGYTVTGGGGLMLGGRLGDLLGRRRVLLLGTGLFGAASLLAGLAPTFSLLVVARLLQGAGEAIALPAAMAAIVLMFPEGPRRSRALSVWAAVASCGLVLGFVLSGIVTAHLGWRWIFLVSVPFVLVVLLAAVFLVEGDRPVAKDAPRLDLLGALLLTACPLLFIFGVVEAGEPGTPAWVAPGALAGVAVCVGIGFAPTLHSLDPFLVATLLAAVGLVTGAVVAWRMPAPAPAADLQEQTG